MSIQFPSISVERFRYDPEEHLAPPIRIQWVTRSANNVSHERWIFIHCCGQIGRESGESLISTSYSCKKASSKMRTTSRHHSGKLSLKRKTHNQVVVYKPPLVRWTCCGAEIPTWDDSWQSRDGKIPFDFVDSGCEDGPYVDQEDGVSNNHNMSYALLARPLQRKPKPCSTSNTSRSSGEQTYVIEERKLMETKKIKFTQESVLKTFSDKSKPSLLETMLQIFNGDMKIEDLPLIRVAIRGNVETTEAQFFTCDNRRLLIFKVLGIKEVVVKWIGWTNEFDDKLQQNIRFDPVTRICVNDNGYGINDFRQELLEQICINCSSDSVVFIPSKCVGYIIGTEGKTIRILCGKYGASMKITPLVDRVLSSDVHRLKIEERKNSGRMFKPDLLKKEVTRMVLRILHK